MIVLARPHLVAKSKSRSDQMFLGRVFSVNQLSRFVELVWRTRVNCWTSSFKRTVQKNRFAEMTQYFPPLTLLVCKHLSFYVIIQPRPLQVALCGVICVSEPEAVIGCRHGKQSEWQDGSCQSGRAGKHSLLLVHRVLCCDSSFIWVQCWNDDHLYA